MSDDAAISRLIHWIRLDLEDPRLSFRQQAGLARLLRHLRQARQPRDKE